MANSLYVHVPFCKTICHYCDFTRTLYNEEIANEWLCRIKEDIHNKKMKEALTTIYIGGGTPTSLEYKQLEKLLSFLQPYSKNVVEYTIESNIESLNYDKILLLKKYGINRISLGVQSLQNTLLEDMNRKHRKKDVLAKIEEIYNAGITNISIDMMYGFDIQKIEMWKEDLNEIVSWDKISHISLYSLTIEENSVFGKRNRKTVENEVEALMYDCAIEILEKHGFIQYEIANFARAGKESMHNQVYWEYDDFYGIGIGASGKEEGKRYDYIGSIKQYINHTEKINVEVLSEMDQIFENIMMSLRMRKGLNLKKFETRYKKDIQSIYKQEIEEEISADNLIFENGYLKATKKGMFYLHDILIKFLR